MISPLHSKQALRQQSEQQQPPQQDAAQPRPQATTQAVHHLPRIHRHHEQTPNTSAHQQHSFNAEQVSPDHAAEQQAVGCAATGDAASLSIGGVGQQSAVDAAAASTDMLPAEQEPPAPLVAMQQALSHNRTLQAGLKKVLAAVDQAMAANWTKQGQIRSAIMKKKQEQRSAGVTAVARLGQCFYYSSGTLLVSRYPETPFFRHPGINHMLALLQCELSSGLSTLYMYCGQACTAPVVWFLLYQMQHVM